MKKSIFRLLCLALSLALLGCLVSCGKEETATGEPMSVEGKTFVPTSETTEFVRMDVEGFGKILIQLYPGVAPITVKNFQKLVGMGFYDGLTFHRIIEGMMIQGGDPNGNGSGGPGWEIKGEFLANGVENYLAHTRGALSMARAQGYDTAGSQFFIVQQDYPAWNGMYAAFGMVIDGIEVVDAIAAVKTNANDRPLENVVINKIEFMKEA